jgi:hypothetical protein
MKVGLTYDLRDEYLSEGMSAEESAEFDRPDTYNRCDRKRSSVSRVQDGSEGTGKGMTKASKIVYQDASNNVCFDLLERYQQPVLLEPFLPERESTVGIISTGKDARSVGVLEVILRPKAESDVYSYTNKELYEELVTYRIARDAMAERAADIALRGLPILCIKTGASYQELIRDIMESALRRLERTYSSVRLDQASCDPVCALP